MIPLALSLITGTAGRVIGIAAVIVALVGGGLWLLHAHDRAVAAEAAVADLTARAAAEHAQHEQIVAALTAEAADAEARALVVSNIKRTVDNAPASANCAGSAAIRAALSGLRKPAAAPSAAGSTVRVTVLPGTARAP